jgi:hypothetical protein
MPPAALKIESIVIDFYDSSWKIGPGKYQLGTRQEIEVKFWWTTFTNQGTLGGKDCTVVVQIRRTNTKALISDGDFRTAECSYAGGWVGMYVPEGSFQLSVRVEASNGSTRTASSNFSVYSGGS